MNKLNQEDTIINVEGKIDDITKFKGQWFVVACYSGSADKVAASLCKKVETAKLNHLIFDVRVIHQIVKSKRTKKIEQKNQYPGYIFVNMHMDNEAWYIVRNTEGVTGFVGSSGRGTKPFPMPKIEAKKVLENVKRKDGADAVTSRVLYKANFIIDDYIKVDGTAFDGQEGQVILLDDIKGLATVKLEIFGRYTPTTIPYENCEKII